MMCEDPEDHKFVSLRQYKYACAHKGCEAVWGSLSFESDLRSHLKAHNRIYCNVCGFLIRKLDEEYKVNRRNFELALVEMGKHYDMHLVNNDGEEDGFRCRFCKKKASSNQGPWLKLEDDLKFTPVVIPGLAREPREEIQRIKRRRWHGRDTWSRWWNKECFTVQDDFLEPSLSLDDLST